MPTQTGPDRLGVALIALPYIGAGNSENLPLTVTVSNLVSSLGDGWQVLGPAAFLSMALPLAVIFALQRHFVRGITGGAVKGGAVEG